VLLSFKICATSKSHPATESSSATLAASPGGTIFLSIGIGILRLLESESAAGPNPTFRPTRRESMIAVLDHGSF
jgi:hypothetical protein